MLILQDYITTGITIHYFVINVKTVNKSKCLFSVIIIWTLSKLQTLQIYFQCRIAENKQGNKITLISRLLKGQASLTHGNKMMSTK